jgi:hypothetical protein
MTGAINELREKIFGSIQIAAIGITSIPLHYIGTPPSGIDIDCPGWANPLVHALALRQSSSIAG